MGHTANLGIHRDLEAFTGNIESAATTQIKNYLEQMSDLVHQVWTGGMPVSVLLNCRPQLQVKPHKDLPYLSYEQYTNSYSERPKLVGFYALRGLILINDNERAYVRPKVHGIVEDHHGTYGVLLGRKAVSEIASDLVLPRFYIASTSE